MFPNKLKSLKVAKLRKDEWRIMKNNDGWMKNDEGWWFQAVEGFCWRTDRRTDAFATEKFPPIGNIIVDPSHGSTEHLVFWVHSEIFWRYELGQKILVDLVELFLLTDKVEVVVDIVQSYVPQTTNIVSLSKSINS